MTHEEYQARHRERYAKIMRREMTLGEALDLDRRDKRVLSRVNGDAAGPEFGSPPHHERVLAVVLVMPGAPDEITPRVVRVPPDYPHWEEFWQDIGRPPEGQGGTPKDSESDACVQPACPTACRGGLGVCPDWCSSCEPPTPTMRWDEKAGQWNATIAYTIDASVLREAERNRRADLEAIADRCNAFWRDRGRRWTDDFVQRYYAHLTVDPVPPCPGCDTTRFHRPGCLTLRGTKADSTALLDYDAVMRGEGA
jgi:hypothetical protein